MEDTTDASSQSLGSRYVFKAMRGQNGEFIRVKKHELQRRLIKVSPKNPNNQLIPGRRSNELKKEEMIAYIIEKYEEISDFFLRYENQIEEALRKLNLFVYPTREENVAALNEVKSYFHTITKNRTEEFNVGHFLAI